MNSRQRRKLEAQQHNDALDYERWLKENAQCKEPTSSNAKASAFKLELLMGMSRFDSLIFAKNAVRKGGE